MNRWGKKLLKGDTAWHGANIWNSSSWDMEKRRSVAQAHFQFCLLHQVQGQCKVHETLSRRKKKERECRKERREGGRGERGEEEKKEKHFRGHTAEKLFLSVLWSRKLRHGTVVGPGLESTPRTPGPELTETLPGWRSEHTTKQEMNSPMNTMRSSDLPPLAHKTFHRKNNFVHIKKTDLLEPKK